MANAFAPRPEGEPMTDADYLRSALEQPMSMSSTFYETGVGDFLHTFVAGSLVRELMTPPLAGDPPAPFDSEEMKQNRREYFERNALSEDQYKGSPYFRDNVPWEEGMTRDRAAALADQSDRQKVRDFYRAKRPITAFFGSLAGSALDPINYVPILGEGVAAANVARFGKVLGRAVTSSVDAMANTALASVATAPVRSQFGDDASLQSTVSQIAMGAVIGGAFGAIHGRFGKQVDPELLKDAHDRLSTLENVQKSRVALNDAIDGMVHEGAVDLSPASEGIVNDVAGTDLPRFMVDRMARDADPESFARGDAEGIAQARDQARQQYFQDRALLREETAKREARNVRPLDEAVRLMDYAPPESRERPAGNDIRNLGQDTPVLFQKADAALALDILEDGSGLNRKTPRVRKSGQVYPPVHVDPGGQIDLHWADTLDHAGELGPRDGVTIAMDAGGVRGKLRGETKSGKAQYISQNGVSRHKVIGVLVEGEPDKRVRDLLQRKVDAGEWVSRDFRKGKLYLPRQQRRSALSASFHPETVDMRVPQEPYDPKLAAAAARVGKAEVRETFGIDPETGHFPEIDDIEALRQAGRLTPEDEALLNDAADVEAQAKGFGEALKAFARCAV